MTIIKSLITLIKRNTVASVFIALLALSFFKYNKNKKIFISFAIEDKRIRDLLVGQSKHTDSPFEFVDNSVHEPWDSSWKTNCREVIKESDGVIALISKDSYDADGQRWEIKCAIKEKKLLLAIYAYKDRKKRGEILPELKGMNIHNWSWSCVSNFIEACTE